MAIAMVLSAISGTFAGADSITMGLRQLAGISTLCAGGLVLGESVLLLIGMNVPTASPWSTTRNVMIASSDVVLGGLLAGLAIMGPATQGGGLYYGAAAVLLVTHLFRDAELIAGWSQPFAANPALVVFNNIRLALVGLSLGLTLAL